MRGGRRVSEGRGRELVRGGRRELVRGGRRVSEGRGRELVRGGRRELVRERGGS